MNKKRMIVIILIFILLCSLFLFINCLAIKNREYIDKNTTTTTVKIDDEFKIDVRKDKIMIEGMEEVITVATYKSHLGYKLDYDIELFAPKLLNNGTVIFTHIYNENVSLKLEKMTKTSFDENKNNEIREEVIDDFKYTYDYLSKGDIYIKSTIIMPNSTEYADMYTRVYYMVNSLTKY